MGVTPVFTALSVPADAAATFTIIGDGSTITFTASDRSGGYFNLRVFRIARNRYQIWDGTAVSVKYDNDQNRWTETSDGDPEHGTFIGQKPVSFRSGAAYIHDDLVNKAKLYGTQHDVGFSAATNQYPGDIKNPMFISIDCVHTPAYVHIRTEKPYVQSSDITGEEFEDKEGMYYAEVKFDRLTPDAESYDDGLLTGDGMRGDTILVTAVFNQDLSEEGIDAIDINYKLSKGHK